MRRHLRYLFTGGGLLLLLGMGFLLSRSAGAQPAPDRPAAPPQLTTRPSPTPACPSGWTIYPNPAPPGDSTLYGLTALAPNDLWAVGAYTSTGIITATTLTVHGDGTSWTTVASPSPPSSKSVLQAVAGVASNDVWAVGEYIGGQYSQWQTLTMHWDGTAWTIVPSPNNIYNNRLYAVRAIASNDVWAVGMYGSAGFHVWGLIEHWDGTSWSIVPTPGGSSPPLYGVAAASANDVWAVGGGIPDYPAYGLSYIAHWDGSAWATVANPPNSGASLHAVSVASASDVWAVGYTGGYGTGQSLIEHWDGSAWTDVASPNPGATTNLLYGVSARASNDVWAVGDTNQASGGVKTFALHWDGTGWYQAPTPASPTGRDLFYGVVAPPAAGGVVWAVGEMGCTSGCTQNALIARADSGCLTPVPTWTPTPTNTATPACGLDWRGVPSPPLPNGSEIDGVAAVSANDIWAVGRYYPNNYIQALTEHWDGTQWSIVPYDPNPGGTSILFAVAAVAANDVWAVGSGGGTITMHWDGSSWTRVPSPSPGDYHSLSGVVAVASNDVWAVGGQQTNGLDSTLIEHWNGSAWSVVSSPSVGSYSHLNAVAAVAGNANDLWAVGYSSGPQTLVEHWNGTQWSIVPSPGASQLQSVAAVAANDVWAVGCSLYCNEIGSQTLVEHWNGATWSIVSSPNPFAGNNQLFGVAAVAGNDVWAVGFSSPNSSPYQTLIEHWNGTQWSAVPGPRPPGSALYGVAAVAANNVWAGGGLGYSGGFIAHYNDPCAGSVTPTRTPTALSTPTRTPTATATATCVPAGPPGPWTTRANYPQSFMGVALGSDGTTVYSFGGFSTGRHIQDYKYNYATDSWTALADYYPDASGMAEAEYGHNGKIYVIGGNSFVPGVNRVYDIASDSWSQAAPVPTQLVDSFGHAYWDGKIYVIGGLGYTPASNAVYAYDIATDSWSTLAPLPQAECCMAAAAFNGKIYVANGSDGSNPTNSLYIYDIATNTWSAGPPSPRASSGPGSTVLGGQLYMIGGDIGGAVYTTSTYLYDPASNSWSSGPSLNVPRCCGGNAVTINTPGGQTALVVAGYGPGIWSNSVEASTLPGMPCAAPSATPPSTSTAGAGNTPTRTSTPLPLTVTATIAVPSSATRTPAPPTQTPGGLTATRTRVPPTNTTGPSATPSPPAPPCMISFTDVYSTDYFYAPVRYLYCHGVISGYADNTFRPYNNTTRAQMVKIVVLGFGISVRTPAGGAYTFHDVAPGAPFFDVIETAAAHNIISGYACGPGGPGPCDDQHRPYFLPNNSVTRGQLAKIDAVAAGWPLLNPPTATFTDVPPGSAFYPFVETAVCHGVISGYADHTFRPGATATRGQISKILYLSVTTSASCSSGSAP